MSNAPGSSPFSPPFDSPELDAWRALVQRDLRGADFEGRLVHQGVDGLRTQPLYTRASVGALDQRGAPGQAPWIRGRFPHGRWQAWQLVEHPDPAVAARIAADELEQGAHGLVLPVDASGMRRRGVGLQTAADLSRVLSGLPLVRTWVSLIPGADFLPVSAAYVLALRQAGVSDTDARGVLGADPVGHLASTGCLEGGGRALSWLADLAAWCGRQMPSLRAAVVDTRPWHEAGATDVDQLALALATGVTYLRAMESTGVALPMAFSQLSFRLCLGPELLQGVAQVRALRGLWSRVADACGLDGDPAGGAYVHVLPGHRAMTRRDPWVNLLRNTAVAFAGAVGGADAVTTYALDSELGLPDAHSRRVARNTQTILAAEAHLGRVADPAGGSFFLEARTTELMEAAWARFQELEAAGGVMPALINGTVRTWVDQAWTEQAARVATRQRPLTGVSEFPSLDEAPLPIYAPPIAGPPAVAAELELAHLPPGGQGWLLSGLIDVLAEDEHSLPLTVFTEALSVEPPLLTTEALPRRRLAEPFEELRDRSDTRLDQTGRRPQVHLAVLGDLPEHLDRRTFASNLLAAGGLRAVDGALAMDADSLARSFGASGCGVAVLCSSDQRYTDQAAACVAALAAAGARQIWLAGRPPADADALRQAGLTGCLYLGCDALAVLEQIWQEVAA